MLKLPSHGPGEQDNIRHCGVPHIDEVRNACNSHISNLIDIGPRLEFESPVVTNYAARSFIDKLCNRWVF